MKEKEFNGDLIAARIRALRKEEGISTLRFTPAIGASKNSVVIHWETGRNIPSSYFIFQIASTFGVSADWLLGLTDERRA